MTITVASWLLIVLVYVLTKALGGDPFFLIAGITGVSTVLLYWAYGVCIFLGLRGDQSWRERQTWSLGGWSRPFAWHLRDLDHPDHARSSCTRSG